MTWTDLFHRKSARREQATMEQVWNERLHAGLPAEVDEPARQAICQNLLELETRLATETQPLQALRRELMDSLDRRVLNTEILKLPDDLRVRLRQQNHEILQTDDAAHIYIVANELHMEILRQYSHLRFDDCAEGDWFAVYEKASRLRQRSTRQYLERTLDGTQNATDEARFQSMTLVDNEIRARLLQVPAGTRFPGFGNAGSETA
ncbi:MAG: hypothetical protein ACRESX_00100 [Gammaproteobacteria bacterium]